MRRVTTLKVDLDGRGAWPDFDLGQAARGELLAVAAMPAGMASGRASVGFRILLTDGTEVFTETSLRLFVSAARAFAARYPQDVEGDG